MEQLNLMFECEGCKKRFLIGGSEAVNSLTYMKQFICESKSIFLTYYDCPDCGKRHYVQIDDAYSLELLKEVKRQFIRMSLLRVAGKDIPRKQSVKFKKARQDLSDYRINLMKEYTGKLVRSNETESYSELRFSV